jgi:hypothetical protein
MKYKAIYNDVVATGAGVNPAPVFWPKNGPKRLGIQLASDCGKHPCQWLRQTDLKPPQFALLFYCLKALDICSSFSSCNLSL